MREPQLTDDALWRQWIANGGDKELRTRVERLTVECATLREELDEMRAAYEAQVDTLATANAALLRHIDALQC